MSKSKSKYQHLSQMLITVNGTSFQSCGETTTLNLVNYLLLDPVNDLFHVPDNANTNLVQFYEKYNTIKHMIANKQDTLELWGKLISNVKGVQYNRDTNVEILPSVEHIVNLLIYLLLKQ
jgi:hypothetical protein